MDRLFAFLFILLGIIEAIWGLWVCQNRKPLSKSNVIQSEAKNLEYIKWVLPRSFATLWMTK